MTHMTHLDIIAALGGYRAIADALALPITTVHSWHARGIPPKRWPSVLEIAAERGVTMTWQDLARTQEVDHA